VRRLTNQRRGWLMTSLDGQSWSELHSHLRIFWVINSPLVYWTSKKSVKIVLTVRSDYCQVDGKEKIRIEPDSEWSCWQSDEWSTINDKWRFYIRVPRMFVLKIVNGWWSVNHLEVDDDDEIFTESVEQQLEAHLRE